MDREICNLIIKNSKLFKNRKISKLKIQNALYNIYILFMHMLITDFYFLFFVLQLKQSLSKYLLQTTNKK